jgi:hypothetical protein
MEEENSQSEDISWEQIFLALIAIALLIIAYLLFSYGEYVECQNNKGFWDSCEFPFKSFELTF